MENEYPKFYRYVADFLKKFLTPSQESAESLRKAKKTHDAVRSIFNSLENAYLSKSIARQFDSINLLFQDEQPPSQNDIENLVQGISNELHVAAFDDILFGKVCRNVGKSVHLFSTKSEGLLATNAEASQAVGNPSAAQKKNIIIVNSVHFFREAVLNVLKKFLDQLNEESAAELEKATSGLLQVLFLIFYFQI